MSDCGICNHDEHDAGRCRRCNCGSSEIVSRSFVVALPEIEFTTSLGRLYDRTDRELSGKGDYKLCITKTDEKRRTGTRLF
jgi:hypothetical protein